MKQFYFNRFENKKPYSAVPDSPLRTYLFQFSAIITIALGLSYLHWRWMHSINPQSLWFAIPLVVAETLSFIGTFLMFFNIWQNKDPKHQEPPYYLSDIEELNGRPDRPIKIDVHIATYNEDVELVRYSIRDAKKMTYPHRGVTIKIYILDDGRRDGRNPEKENMKKVAEEEGVGYLTRETNEGYKAGNLKYGLEHTDGDLFVILDADTRPFETFLENTAGYFRNKKIAWVQTPQWFCDITEAQPLSERIKKRLKTGPILSKITDLLFGKIKTGEDIFGNDPRLFYEVLLRRRNFYNAAFCCGAGSFHRREAVLGKAIKDFMEEMQKETNESIHNLLDKEKFISKAQWNKYKMNSFLHQELKPFKFHASEDIYTSMMMHNDSEKWESIQHPTVECKMLSPQDLDTSIKQRTRYASGSLDIAFKDNPFLKKGLSFGQKMCYFHTIWSYFAPLWIIVFLLSPIIFYFTQALPVKAYSFDFFKHFVPFHIMNTIAITIGCWRIDTKRGEQYYIASFWLMLRSLISAIRGQKVNFIVTPKEKQGNEKNLQHVWPHLLIIILTVTGIIYNVILILIDRHPSLSGFASNLLWSLFNIFSLSVIIRAAFWNENEPAAETVAVNTNEIETSQLVTLETPVNSTSGY